MMKNKRGQFYLLAAVIIIALILGYAAYSNYSKKKNVIRLYDLGDQLELESAKILEYGTYNSLNETQIQTLLEGFTKDYAEYSKIEKVYFIFGNVNKITVAGYHEIASGEIQVNLGGVAGTKDLDIEAKTYTSRQYTPGSDVVIIIINGVEYAFELKPGENFYFVLVQTIGGEEYVVTN